MTSIGRLDTVYFEIILNDLSVKKIVGRFRAEKDTLQCYLCQEYIDLKNWEDGSHR